MFKLVKGRVGLVCILYFCDVLEEQYANAQRHLVSLRLSFELVIIIQF